MYSEVLCLPVPAHQGLSRHAAHQHSLLLLSLPILLSAFGLLLAHCLSEYAFQLLIPFLELLVESVGRRPLFALVLLHYLLLVAIPLLQMKLVVFGLLHRLHHLPLLPGLPQVLLSASVDAEDILCLLLLGLLPALLYLLQVGLVPAQLLPTLRLLAPPAVLLLGAALPQVLLLLVVGLLDAVADVGEDFPLLDLLTLDQALQLLLLLHVELQPAQPVVKEFLGDALTVEHRHLVEVLCLEEGLFLEVLVNDGIEDGLVGQFLQQLGGCRTRHEHLSIRIYSLIKFHTPTHPAGEGVEAYQGWGNREETAWVGVCYLMFNKMDDGQLQEEVHWLVASIKDPEKRQCTLEDLDVITSQSVTILHVSQQGKRVKDAPPHNGEERKRGLRVIEIRLKPTNAHCHLIQQIALAVHLRLRRELPHIQEYKLRVICFASSHAKQEEVEKQMNDKERIAAALENDQIVHYLDELLS